MNVPHSIIFSSFKIVFTISYLYMIILYHLLVMKKDLRIIRPLIVESHSPLLTVVSLFKQ